MRYKVTLFLLTMILCLTGLYSCNKNFLLLWDANNIYVSTRNNIDKDKVKIEFGISVNTINRETDAELFADRDKYTVLFEGKLKNKMVNEYGENDFLITYDERCYLSFRHFKTSRRHQHDYYFDFFSNNGNIFVTVEIKGENPLKFTRSLNDTRQQFSPTYKDSTSHPCKVIFSVPS
ncbi:hypothetical protein [Escherichia sp. E4742]|uniref:hypothetical protein n=1 Tax=Escherichia sp. E4742 TaxID=2044467 RepID=UPI0010816E95|nr:hypothetical protein [Escherichia sp. E4742]QCT87310.1 hypothetical protein FEM44_08765 [Escherichia sp. E4742]QLN21026.1 hypothetical protein HVZ29_20265 [Escherichia coli]TGB60070.1 hypothetical protein CRI69_10075 [Escherichia sp. E4742]TLJ06541.1 hypothetical protein FEK62_08760 [Escherichia sp. E4742]